MYYIHDLVENSYLPIESKEALISWWVHRYCTGFEELNVTGKDIWKDYVPCLKKTSNGKLFDEMLPVVYLRRYQIFDEHGRSIDIRQWPKEDWENPPLGTYQHFLFPARPTRPQSHRNLPGRPSLWKSTIKAASEPVDLHELEEDNLPLPRSSQGRIRSRLTEDQFRYGRYTNYTRRCRSWKYQTKKRCQWAKKAIRTEQQVKSGKPVENRVCQNS
ncbi:MAG: hypothetical protein HFF17_13520 [Oscillospiraceae bacterium]|nr:hypothetical protein [Oscillospiraceae bacterium]